MDALVLGRKNRLYGQTGRKRADLCVGMRVAKRAGIEGK